MVTEKKEETPQEVLTSSEFERLKSELGETRKKLEETQKSLSAQDRRLSERDKELKRREALDAKIDSMEDRIKILASVIAETQGQTEGEFEATTQTKKPNLAKTYEELERKSVEKRKQEEFQRKAGEYEAKVVDLGLTRKDNDYWDVYDMVAKGQFERADVLLEKLGDAKNIVKALEVNKPAGETEEQRIDKLAEEKARKLMEERGLLTTDTGNPTAAGKKIYTMTDVRKMSAQEYKKLFPTYGDYYQAVQEGRIKE